MATGKLAGVDILAGAETQVYQCPTTTFAVVTVSICNRGNTTSQIRLAISDTVLPIQAPDYIEFDTNLAANGVLERTGIVLAAGQRIIARSSNTSVSFVVYGIETPTV
jgi:hypothetical protein